MEHDLLEAWHRNWALSLDASRCSPNVLFKSIGVYLSKDIKMKEDKDIKKRKEKKVLLQTPLTPNYSLFYSWASFQAQLPFNIFYHLLYKTSWIQSPIIMFFFTSQYCLLSQLSRVGGTREDMLWQRCSWGQTNWSRMGRLRSRSRKRGHCSRVHS